MKKFLILLLVILACVSSAFAMLDKNGVPLPLIAPDGTKSQTLTVINTSIDMSSSSMWTLYSPTACKARILPTTVRGTKPAFTIPVTTVVSRGVNKNTPFVNFTGCTSGELQRE